MNIKKKKTQGGQGGMGGREGVSYSGYESKVYLFHNRGLARVATSPKYTYFTILVWLVELNQLI